MNEDLPYQKTMLDYVAADTSGHEFKNAFAFLLRDARHAMHDILLLRISAILPKAISDVGVISHLIYTCVNHFSSQFLFSRLTVSRLN